MNNPEFYIVNDTDAPTEEMVTQRVNNELQYINERHLNYPHRMTMRRATNLEDFGFKIEIENGVATFFLSPDIESKATYEDGVSRNWQGRNVFSLWMIRDKPTGGQLIHEKYLKIITGAQPYQMAGQWNDLSKSQQWAWDELIDVIKG